MEKDIHQKVGKCKRTSKTHKPTRSDLKVNHISNSGLRTTEQNEPAGPFLRLNANRKADATNQEGLTRQMKEVDKTGDPIKICKNPNHPKKGSSIKVQPIRDRSAMEIIKKNLIRSPRDILLFTLGINTAFRANELLSLKVIQVRNLKPGDDLEIKLSKTNTYRRVTINQGVYQALQTYFQKCKPADRDPLFKSKRTNDALSVSTVSKMVKRWCRDAGLQGNYASHTLRKTWGYQQRVAKDTPIPLLMAAFGHATQKQTLTYLCIQEEEIAEIYMDLVL